MIPKCLLLGVVVVWLLVLGHRRLVDWSLILLRHRSLVLLNNWCLVGLDDFLLRLFLLLDGDHSLLHHFKDGVVVSPVANLYLLELLFFLLLFFLLNLYLGFSVDLLLWTVVSHLLMMLLLHLLVRMRVLLHHLLSRGSGLSNLVDTCCILRKIEVKILFRRLVVVKATEKIVYRRLRNLLLLTLYHSLGKGIVFVGHLRWSRSEESR